MEWACRCARSEQKGEQVPIRRTEKQTARRFRAEAQPPAAPAGAQRLRGMPAGSGSAIPSPVLCAAPDGGLDGSTRDGVSRCRHPPTPPQLLARTWAVRLAQPQDSGAEPARRVRRQRPRSTPAATEPLSAVNRYRATVTELARASRRLQAPKSTRLLTRARVRPWPARHQRRRPHQPPSRSSPPAVRQAPTRRLPSCRRPSLHPPYPPEPSWPGPSWREPSSPLPSWREPPSAPRAVRRG